VRWLLLVAFWVPICFLAAPSRQKPESLPVPPEVYVAGALFGPVGSPANQPWLTLGYLAYAENIGSRMPYQLKSLPLGVPAGDYLAGVPWFTIALTQMEENERLILLDPPAFLEKCLDHYDANVHSYSCTFLKHELVRQPKGGVKQRTPETISVAFRQDPFSVYFKWLKGGDLIPRRTLYVAGENNNKLVLPLPPPLNIRDPEDEEARKRSRYPITQFGMRFGLQHVYDSWRGSQQAQISLAVKYHGKQTPPDDTELCYKLESFRGEPEPPDGCVRAVLYISVKDLLLIRSELYGENDKRIAIYHFKDLKLNRDFDEGQFQPSVLQDN
jgi:hypothetical protein